MAPQLEAASGSSAATCVLVALCSAWCLGGHQLARRYSFLTEGSAAAWLGLVTGVGLLVGHRLLDSALIRQLLEFSASNFFTYLLPPIIFHAGLCVERSHFFAALPSILALGLVGTLASWLLIAGSLALLGALFGAATLQDCLAMGAIFAATDSVAVLQVLDRDSMPALWALVFGEGVVNDAVSVVLLSALAGGADGASGGGSSSPGQHQGVSMPRLVMRFAYLMATSLGLGAAAGQLIATVLARVQLRGPHQELSAIVLIAYLSYLLADVAGLSAIVTLFVCGVVVSHYALQSASPAGREVTLSAVASASHISEGIIFVYLGSDSLDPLKWAAARPARVLWLVLVLTVVLVAARALVVVVFALAHNACCTPAARLARRDVVAVWWAGLMRGAVSVALAYQYWRDEPGQMPDAGRATLIVSTLMVVLFSVLGFGALTKPLLAGMFQGEAEAAALAAQLSRIPLLGSIARNASASNLFSNNGPGGSGPSTPGHSRHTSGLSGGTGAAGGRSSGGWGRGGGGGGGGGAAAAATAALGALGLPVLQGAAHQSLLPAFDLDADAQLLELGAGGGGAHSSSGGQAGSQKPQARPDGGG